jgi:hypothetical protein
MGALKIYRGELFVEKRPYLLIVILLNISVAPFKESSCF